MDGVDGRYQDSRTSSPEESLSGSYIKVVLRNGHQCMCEIHEGNAGVLEKCRNCGFYLTKWVRLVCEDTLCEGCFKESGMYYTCPVHVIRTTTYQAKTGSFQHNPKCHSISIKCPACRSTPDLRSIEEHIAKCHPEFGARKSTELQYEQLDKTESSSSRESLKCNAQSSGDSDLALFNVGQSRPPRHVSSTEMDKREPGRNKVHHKYNLRSSKDPELPTPEKSEPKPVHNAKLDQTEQRRNEAPADHTHSSPCGRGLQTNPELSGPVHCAAGVNTAKRGPQNMKALYGHSHHSPETTDPKYGNPEKLKPSERIASAEKERRGPGAGNAFCKCNLRCSDGGDPEFSNPQEPNSSQRGIHAGMEHVETYNGMVACEKCKVRVHFSDMQRHTQLCKAEDSKKSTPSSDVKQEEDDRAEEKELDDNIQELKERIKALENRLEDIEKPLLKILERLRRGY